MEMENKNILYKIISSLLCSNVYVYPGMYIVLQLNDRPNDQKESKKEQKVEDRGGMRCQGKVEQATDRESEKRQLIPRE